MTSVDGSPFSAVSFDAAEGFLVAGSLLLPASQLEIEGSLAGGGTVTEVVDFDGLNDGTGPGVDFESFALPGTFINLTSVTFRALTASGNPGDVLFSLDNIDASVVPVPATVWLLGSGLLGLARFKRQRWLGKRSASQQVIIVIRGQTTIFECG